ncbi:MAG TPA: hypothetical protein VIO38_01015, partial [Rariglobus sp.]
MADEATIETPADETLDEEVETPPEGADSPDEDTAGKFDQAKALDKIKKLNSEAANLRKRAKEAEEKATGADEATKRLPTLEAENLRLKVGIKHGLPEAIIDRLKGSTEEELLADAETLLEFFTPGKSGAPPSQRPKEDLRGGTDPTQTPVETDVRK